MVGDQDAALVQQVEDTMAAGSADPDAASVTAVEVADAEAAEQAVTDGDADAALLPTDDGYELVGEDEIDPALAGGCPRPSPAVSCRPTPTSRASTSRPSTPAPQVDQRFLDPDAEDSGTRSTIAFAFTLMFLVTALGYGMTIAQSVVQEKESRVVEILAAAIPIRSLLWGKISATPCSPWDSSWSSSPSASSACWSPGAASPAAGSARPSAWYVVFFVLGFLALAALWAVAGSLSSRQEDLQSTTLPMQMLLFIPYFVVAFASDGVEVVMSMVPVASSMIMPARMAEGAVPAWQIGVAIAATVAAAVLFVRVGSRIYERTLLRSGGRIGLREALRLGAS